MKLLSCRCPAASQISGNTEFICVSSKSLWERGYWESWGWDLMQTQVVSGSDDLHALSFGRYAAESLPSDHSVVINF